MIESISAEVGIDVSMEKLEVNLDGRRLGHFANSEDGLARIRDVLPQGSRVHIEASGGYDRLARRLLTEWGFQVKVHNPRKVRRMADGLGFIAKNDALDAQALVEVGPIIKSKPAKSAEQEKLCDISRAIKTLTDQIAEFRLRMKTPQLPEACVDAYAKVVQEAQRQIAFLEKYYLSALDESCFRERFDLAISVRGVGQATARVVSCELTQDLSGYSTRQITSYAGLAPMDHSSGKRNGPKHIAKGNVHLKKAMYMPALWAIANQEWASSGYHRLRASGRTHDQAIVPIMRKMLIRIVAVIKRGSPYVDEPSRVVRQQ